MATELGALIARFRTKKNMTQQELAQRINISKTNISNYETGYSNPDDLTIRKISEALEVDLISMTTQPLSKQIRKNIAQIIDQNKIADNITQIYNTNNYTGVVNSSFTLIDGAICMPYDPDYNTNCIFGIRLLDNSMSKSYLPANSIGIFRYDIPVKNNTIVAVNIKKTEEIVVRYYSSEGGLVLLTDNSYYTEPKTSQYYEDDIEILGSLITKIVKDNV